MRKQRTRSRANKFPSFTKKQQATIGNGDGTCFNIVAFLFVKHCDCSAVMSPNFTQNSTSQPKVWRATSYVEFPAITYSQFALTHFSIKSSYIRFLHIRWFLSWLDVIKFCRHGVVFPWNPTFFKKITEQFRFCLQTTVRHWERRRKGRKSQMLAMGKRRRRFLVW